MHASWRCISRPRLSLLPMASPKQLKQYLDEVKDRIAGAAPVIPAQRKAFRAGFSFSKAPFEEQLPIWDHIWKRSNTFILRAYAFFFLEQYMRRKDHHKWLWQTSCSWQEEVDDWALCDSLAKINTQALTTLPGEIYTQLTKWNKDKDLWKRRQSVVSLLYFSRTKTVYLPFEKIALLVVPLLGDKEYYVQKGVGWALREMHTIYPVETLALLQKHIRAFSAIAFTIAIEKMNVKEKAKLKAMRRA